MTTTAPTRPAVASIPDPTRRSADLSSADVAYAGIDASSVPVDAVDRTGRLIAAAEQRLLLDSARRTPVTRNRGNGHV